MRRPSIDDFARRKLESLERRRLRRSLTSTERARGAEVLHDDRPLISFACNDYLGLATDPATIAASRQATERYGVGAGASRLISGNHPLYRTLEAKLARIKGTEDAAVFGSGYLANVGSIPVFVGSADLLLVDELSHSCVLAGAAISRATVMSFPHNDVGAAGALLSAHRADYRHCLLVTEGVFSMDGDLAPLPALGELAAKHDAWLMTDDAHGLGVVGAGRGSSFAHGVAVDVPLQMGTLSKAVGAYGGYLCASQTVVELVRNRARSFVYSTGLPPGTVAAASCALDVIESGGERVARPLAHARAFADALGLAEARSAIVPITLGSVAATLDAAQSLANAGFLVPAIRPPTVPAGTSRLRFAFSAAHSDDDVKRLIAAVRAVGMAG